MINAVMIGAVVGAVMINAVMIGAVLCAVLIVNLGSLICVSITTICSWAYNVGLCVVPCRYSQPRIYNGVENGMNSLICRRRPNDMRQILLQRGSLILKHF